MRTFSLIFLALMAGQPVLADEPKVEAVSVKKVGMVWNIHVTLRHGDTGWEHYADGWEILDAEGKRLGYRELMHPHVAEQPFTRALSGVVIPDGTREIFIRPRCSTSGWASEAVRVPLRP